MVSFLRMTAKALSHPLLAVQRGTRSEFMLACRIKLSKDINKLFKGLNWMPHEKAGYKAKLKLIIAKELLEQGDLIQNYDAKQRSFWGKPSIIIEKAEIGERNGRGYGPIHQVKAFYFEGKRFAINFEVTQGDMFAV